MRTLIKNGLLIDPANHVYSKLNVLLDQGKVAAVTADEPEADQIIDKRWPHPSLHRDLPSLQQTEECPTSQRQWTPANRFSPSQ